MDLCSFISSDAEDFLVMKTLRGWIAVAAAFALVSSCFAQDFSPLAATISKDIVASGRKSVAVVDFTNLNGQPTELGRYLAEEFSDALVADAKSFDVIDRTHLEEILQEHKLESTGLISPSTIMKLGKISGVQTIVTGTITPFEDSVSLSVQVIDTQSARVFGAGTFSVPRTKTISQLLAESTGGASSGGSNTGSSSSGAQNTDSGSAQAQQVHLAPVHFANGNFTINMMGCKVNGEKILCEGHITDTGSSAEQLITLESSYMLDASGDESKAVQSYGFPCRIGIQVGSKRENPVCSSDTEFQPGLAMKFWVWASGLSLDTPDVSIVLNTESGTAIMRNVPVLKQ